MKVPFTKAHGARNDFLLSWRRDVPEQTISAATAVAICDRHTGAGADGWLLVSETESADAAIDLWNSDGSRSEISGNGTRCAAALLVDSGLAGTQIRIATGAGIKHLRMLDRRGLQFDFEMNMGRPRIDELHAQVQGFDAVILNAGNPQCAILVTDFEFDWRAAGAAIEHDPRFPNRTNVSFVRAAGPHAVEARFWERGAGETMSSGTGSTGAAAAAVARAIAASPIEVRTPAGPLELRWEGSEILLAGPAEIVAHGEFFLP
jgi:diaminopimelate epimerase